MRKSRHELPETTYVLTPLVVGKHRADECKAGKRSWIDEMSAYSWRIAVWIGDIHLLSVDYKAKGQTVAGVKVKLSVIHKSKD
uniref:Uncharacterized protein n=1 Tax=Onchocerca volvulus TaxID=6282 RepID=A0A8R1XVL5_ONCVO